MVPSYHSLLLLGHSCDTLSVSDQRLSGNQQEEVLQGPVLHDKWNNGVAEDL